MGWILSDNNILQACLSSTSIFLIFVFLFYYLQPLSKHRGRQLSSWPILGMLPDLVHHRNNLHDAITSTLSDHGSNTFFLNGPWLSNMSYLVTCHPQNANHILNTSFPNYPNGPDFAEIFDILGHGILTVDGSAWSSQRKTATAHLASPGFRSLMMGATEEKLFNVLIPLLDRAATRGDPVDIADLSLRLTSDASCAAVLGVDPGCFSPDLPDFPFGKAVDKVEQVTLSRHLMPKSLWKLLRWLQVGGERKLAESWAVMDQFIAQCIQTKIQELKQGAQRKRSADMLTSYIEHHLLDDESKFKYVRDSVVTMVIAGKDTTGITFGWFFWLLIKHPHVEEKLLKELMKCDGEDIEAAVYLHAVVLETLRLYPPIPFSHKQCLKGERLPSGHQVKSGMNVIFPTYSAGRMEGVWGEDCVEFKPERWIVTEGDGRLKIKHEPSHKFLAFLSGPRTCMGKNLAMIQLKKVIAAVVSRYQFELVEGHVVEPKLSMMLRMKDGLMVKVSKRETN